MVYYSELIGKPVIDSQGKEISIVKDFCFFDKARYANISGVSCMIDMDGKGKKEKIILWKFVEAVGDKPADYFPLGIYLNKNISEISLLNLNQEEAKKFSFLNSIIDKQLIDINGARIIRVNDILLGMVGKKFSLIGVDISAKGLLRRLKVVRFFKKVQEHIILWKDVAPISKDDKNIKLKVKREKLNELHPAELADMIRDLNIEEKLMVFNSLDKKKAAETLLGAHPDVQKTFFKTISLKKIAELLETLPSNEAAAILEMMPTISNAKVLRLVKPGIASKIKKVLSYREKTAGTLMSTKFLTIRQEVNVGKAIELIKTEMPNPKHISYIYVKDSNDELKGIISLRDLILANKNKKILDLVKRDIITVNVNTQTDYVFNLMNKYSLLALPVIDKSKKIVGVIRVNDILKIMIPQKIKHQRILKNKLK